MNRWMSSASVALALLASVPTQPAVLRADQEVRAAGARACAVAAAAARWYGADNRYMTPHELVRRSLQRRRARQTHPRKRGRR